MLTPFGLIDRFVKFLQVILQAEHVERDVIFEILVGLHYELFVLFVEFVLVQNVVGETWKLKWYKKCEVGRLDLIIIFSIRYD